MRHAGRDADMRDIIGVATRLAATAGLLLALGGCTTDSSTGGVLPKPESILNRPDWATFSGAKNEFVLRAVSAEDLINADGQCAAVDTGQASGFADPQQGAAPTAPGVALQMTECDVVRRAGTPEKVNLGADERGDRTAVLTYTRGPLPGVYRFIGGRLSAMERAPGAPTAAKPQKPAKPAKKPAA
jgi:hypothetical protein